MYRVELENKGEMVFSVKSQDYMFNIDLKGKGMIPPDVFLAGLASCMGVYFRKYLEGAKLGIEEFKIIAEAELSSEVPICFRAINIKIDTKGVYLDEKRKLAVIDFIKNCPVHNTIKNNPEVRIEV
ncbi:MAG: OsmC family protein, partial [Candidatus Omnitrophica bacterium]|nr:OsmC family protein [Candidatus Omnitrophota bacterium]